MEVIVTVFAGGPYPPPLVTLVVFVTVTVIGEGRTS